MSFAVYAYWAGTIPISRRSQRYAFGTLRPRHIDAMVMILLLANPVQGLDNAVRRQAKYSGMDGFAAAGPSHPLHREPTDGDVAAKVDARSAGGSPVQNSNLMSRTEPGAPQKKARRPKFQICSSQYFVHSV